MHTCISTLPGKCNPWLVRHFQPQLYVAGRAHFWWGSQPFLTWGNRKRSHYRIKWISQINSPLREEPIKVELSGSQDIYRLPLGGIVSWGTVWGDRVLRFLGTEILGPEVHMRRGLYTERLRKWWSVQSKEVSPEGPRCWPAAGKADRLPGALWRALSRGTSVGIHEQL